MKNLVHKLPNHDKLSEQDFQANMCLIFVIVGLISLVLSLLSIHTIISIGIIFAGIGLFFLRIFKLLQEKGLIHYIPLKFHKVLLHRSLFDILCDIWFIPRITIYLKAFIGPFIYRIKPEEAIHNLEELDPGVKKALLTKGVIYLFPKVLRRFLMPKKNHTHRIKANDNGFDTDSEGSSSSLSDGNPRSAGEILFGKNEKKIELSNLIADSPADNQNTFSFKFEGMTTQEEKIPGHKKHKSGTKKNPLLYKNEKMNSPEPPIKAMILKKGKSTSNASAKKDLNLSKNSPLPFVNQSIKSPNQSAAKLEEKPFIKQAFSRDLTEENAPMNKEFLDGYPQGEEEEKKEEGEAVEEVYIPLVDSTSMEQMARRTKVINSSKKIAKKSERKPSSRNMNTGSDSEVIITEKWDNLELFETKRQEKLDKIKAGLIKQRKPLTGPLSLVAKLIEIRKNGLSKFISGRSLVKVFSISSVALILQFFVSKRARSWLSHTVVLLFYIICFIISSGTLGLAVFKMIKEGKEVKKDDKKAPEQKEVK